MPRDYTLNPRWEQPNPGHLKEKDSGTNNSRITTKTRHYGETEIQQRKILASSTNSLDSEGSRFIEQKMSINAMHYKPPDNLETQIQLQKYLEYSKPVTKTRWEDEVEISDE